MLLGPVRQTSGNFRDLRDFFARSFGSLHALVTAILLLLLLNSGVGHPFI